MGWYSSSIICVNRVSKPALKAVGDHTALCPPPGDAVGPPCDVHHQLLMLVSSFSSKTYLRSDSFSGHHFSGFLQRSDLFEVTHSLDRSDPWRLAHSSRIWMFSPDGQVDLIQVQLPPRVEEWRGSNFSGLPVCWLSWSANNWQMPIRIRVRKISRCQEEPSLFFWVMSKLCWSCSSLHLVFLIHLHLLWFLALYSVIEISFTYCSAYSFEV